jgi:rfaE bifunctional protein nucleotidyltransferase chain/domain
MSVDLERALLAKISDLQTTKAKVDFWKSEGDKVVFTNGVFDLLHIGHITYMAKAADLGDRLVVGLNADSSVKRIKGESRPINDQANRAALLAALFFVDAVVIFEEDTPINVISTLLPDILVKGSDYTVDTIVGAKEVLANGGELVEGSSSTSIIQRIQGKSS